MKQKIIFAAVMFVACIWVIFLLVTLAARCSAVYVPEVHGYDPGVDYMARMVEAAEDGSPWALAMGRVYEQLRNEKIDDRGMDYAKTDFFKSGDAKKVRALIAEYLAPAEPEPVLEYLGRFWCTGYDICVQCCGKTDGVTASGAMATVGRTIAASSEFPFGTRLYIEGIGERVVEDRGGAIGGGRIDVLCHDHEECYAITGWRDVYLIREG